MLRSEQSSEFIRIEGGKRLNSGVIQVELKRPLITVITVVFNGDKYIEETIASVVNQQTDKLEYIVVDGGSTDGTLNIIKRYDCLIDYWVSEEDRGIYDAMNKGFNLSTGSWVFYLNSNDTLIDSLIISKISCRFKTDKKIIHFNCKVVDDHFDEVNVRKYPVFPECLRKWPCVQHQSVFCHRDVFVKVGGFSTEYFLLADYDFFCRAITQGFSILAYRDVKVSVYNSQGVSADFDKTPLLMKESRYIQRSHFGEVNWMLQFQLAVKYIITRSNFGINLVKLIRRTFLEKR